MDGRETMRRDWNYPRFWNHPPEFFCQMHGENHTHDTSHCIVLRKEFAILSGYSIANSLRRTMQWDVSWVLFSPCIWQKDSG